MSDEIKITGLDESMFRVGLFWHPAPTGRLCAHCNSYLEDLFREEAGTGTGPLERRCSSCHALYSLHD